MVLAEVLANIPDGDMIIGLQGGSAVGKSTVGAALARRLRGRVYDIGTVYRAMTAVARIRNLDLSDAAACAAFARECRLEELTGGQIQLMQAGKPFRVTKALRSPWVTANVATLANYPEVWVQGTLMARHWIGQPVAPTVVIGRHLHSVYRMRLVVELTRQEDERLRFRAAQEGEAAAAVVMPYDAIDRRTSGIVGVPGEVIRLDLTGQSKAQQLELMVDLVRRAGFAVGE
jgi:cytidylate kinase